MGSTSKPAVGVGLLFGTLVLMRLVEWWILIWLFYDRRISSLRRDWVVAIAGVLWSFTLDIPAVYAMYVTGRMVVC